MLKFDWATKTNYLVCDGCGYPFATRNLPESTAEDGVIEDVLCFDHDGKVYCLDCEREHFGYDANIYLEVAKKHQKKERMNELTGKVGKHNETDSR